MSKSFIEKIAEDILEEYEINENMKGMKEFLKKCFDKESHLKINIVEEWKIQKHEEIKHMAWEIYKETLKIMDLPVNIKDMNSKLNIAFNNAWALTEYFYHKAKAKEEAE